MDHTLLSIKVIPSSGRQAIITDSSGIIKCYLKSPPEGGKANNELVKFLSKKLKLPQEQITIISGATSRNKKVQIQSSFEMDEIYKKLGIEFPQLKI